MQEKELSKKRWQKLAGVLTEGRDSGDYDEVPYDGEFDLPEIDNEQHKREVIARYVKYFKLAGFDGNGIDFSDIEPKSIAAMGEALKKLFG